MTVAARPASVSYQEDGQTVSFPAPFRFKSARALVVERIGTDGTIVALQLGVDYTVTGGATDAGGTVTRTAATAGATLRIRRWTERAQSMTYTTGDRFPATSHEEALDQQMLISQEQDVEIAETRSRALMLPVGEEFGALEGDRPGKVIGFGADPRQPMMLRQGGADAALREDLADPAVGSKAMAFRALGSGAIDQSVNTKLSEIVSVSDFGARGDALFADFSTTAGSNLIVSEAAVFTAADVGKVVYLTNGIPNGVWFASEIVTYLDPRRAQMKHASNIGSSIRRGCWGTDNSDAFEKALSAAKFISIPTGSFIVDNPVDLLSGRTLYGTGISPWEPYTGDHFPGFALTEILVNGILAINARGSNNATIRDLSIKAVGGKQSAYRQPPGYQVGAVGVAITGSTNFTCDNVSVFGLEVGITSHTTSSVLAGPPAISESGVETSEDDESSNVTQMPRLTRMLASDCRRVFRFGTPESAAYTIRDVQISNIVIMLHCGGILEIHWPDGWRLENARLYQCTEYSVYQRKSNFAQIVATVFFETGQDAFVSEDCENTTIAGSTIARTGFYANPVGSPSLYPQRTALKLTRCLTTTFQGSIEKPTGPAVDMTACTTTSLAGAWDTPFWLTGNGSNASGAINLTTSVGTSLAVAIGGENHWVNVFADEASARTLTGHVGSTRFTGITRGAHLQQNGGYVFRLAAELQIGPGGVSQAFGGIQEMVPAGKRLVTRCVEIAASPAQLRVVDNNNPDSAIIWAMTPQTFGSFSLETRNLFSNAGSTDVLGSVPLTLRNPTGAVITLPIGTEIRISTAIIG